MKHRIWDKFGIGLSMLCLVHCILLPFLIGVFPFLNNEFIHHEFHFYFGIFIVVSALLAFIPGYQKHQDKKVILIAICGVLFLIAGIILGHERSEHLHGSIQEYALSIIGSVLLIFAHYNNIKNCRCDHHHH